MKKKLILMTLILAVTAAGLSGCSIKQPQNSEGVDLTNFATPEGFEWEGSYLDSLGTTAVLTIKKNGNNYDCSVNIPSSDFSHIESYEFTAKK